MSLLEPNEGDTVVRFVTSLWTIDLKVFPEHTPKTVENFVGLARSGYYTGTIFHRVIKDFMIQWGDPTGTGRGGKSIFWEDFEDEFHPDLKHVKGAISMANAGPGTNGSQFFIVHANETHYLNRRHSVFGHVIAGSETVDAIAKTPVDRSDKPKTPVRIESVAVGTIKNGSFVAE